MNIGGDGGKGPYSIGSQNLPDPYTPGLGTFAVTGNITLGGDLNTGSDGSNSCGTLSLAWKDVWSYEMRIEELTEPDPPGAGNCVMYARDNLGNQELRVKFEDNTMATIKAQGS